MKVLQIIENLHRGSVERWLLRTYLHAQQIGLQFQWTFYCYLQESGELEQVAEQAGARVVHSPVPMTKKPAFLSALGNEIRSGDYNVIHSHHDFLSAFYYLASIGSRCRRITHVHNTDEALPTPSRIKRALAHGPMRLGCLSMSDRILATSEHALKAFLDGRRQDPVRHRVHYCSIDMNKIWSLTPDRAGVRAELGLNSDAKLLLFVGSMIDLKNPLFVVEMLPHMLRCEPEIAAVFAGTGPDEARIRKRAEELGLAHRVKVLGWREDVHRLMQASDLFVNPRRKRPLEAFGIVNLEAQAAGLRTIISDGISLEPMVAGTLHTQIPLGAGPAEWAKKALEVLELAPLAPSATKQIFRASRFDPDFAVHELHAIYSELKRN